MTLPEEEILGARILIVDDQASNVRLLERLLAEAGYRQVSSTMNSLEACSLFRQHDHDLILLDLQMPGMDGFELMAALGAHAGERYLPVIVLTAQPGHKLRALKAGAKDFLSKPFDLVEVKTRIRNMLEVRLLYRRLEAHNALLERTVQERTAELRESEARYRSLTALAADWHWEQDENGHFTQVSGPVLDMLGLRVEPLHDGSAESAEEAANDGWDEAERARLRAAIAARQPFLDFALSHTKADGTARHFRVSGEPMFTRDCRFIGYRGVGVETSFRPATRPARG
jgi:PAS domain S-box-containing protein